MVDLIGQISLTDAVVTASSVSPMDPFIVEDSDGTEMSYIPVEIEIGEVLLEDMTGIGTLSPDPETSLSAVKLHDEALGGDPLTGELVVGLQALSDFYRESIPHEYTITFVARVSDDAGGWAYLGPYAEQFDNEATVMAEAVGLRSSFEVVAALAHGFRELNQSGTVGSQLEMMSAAVERLRNGDPSQRWLDTAADQRPFTIEATPAEFLQGAEALGVEFAYDGTAAGTGDETVYIRSSEGVGHGFSIGVGSHVAVVLRIPGEPLNVVAVSNDTETILGTIPADVPAGQVAVIELLFDRTAVTGAELTGVRPPNEFERSIADNLGISTEGQLTLE